MLSLLFTFVCLRESRRAIVAFKPVYTYVCRLTTSAEEEEEEDIHLHVLDRK